jgi:hypothetical protein
MSCEFKGSVGAYGGQAILKSDMTLASTRIVASCLYGLGACHENSTT